MSVEIKKVLGEIICWFNATEELPDADTEVLVCIRTSSGEHFVTASVYDDSDEFAGPWLINGGLSTDDKITHWAEMPAGPVE